MFAALRSRVRRSPRTSRIIAIFSVAVCFGSTVHAVGLTPESPGPPDGSTRVHAEANLGWFSNGNKFDLYWGTDPTPPLFAMNLDEGPSTWRTYDPGSHAYTTTYYWRVVARDLQGNESSGPIWSYTTKSENEPPFPPHLEAPDNGATGVPINPILDYWASDWETWVVNFDIYLGTDPDPPLVAQYVGGSYQPALLLPFTVYYWRAAPRDSDGGVTLGPVWTFRTASTTNQVPDTPSDPYPPSVNEAGATPVLTWDCTDPDGEQLTFYVYMGTHIPTAQNPLPLVGTTTQNELQVGPLAYPARYYWVVRAQDSVWSVKGPLWELENGGVPVLFSRFDAQLRGNDVEVRWSLSSDEAMDSYTLFRRESASGPRVAIANEPVQGTEGSYLDTSVRAGKTYEYELVIRTTDGDEFRSQVAAVSLPAFALTLHQNVPNPFNPQTSIRYDLPSSARVRLTIVDVAGRRVRTLVDEQQAAGSREAIWTGRDDMGNAVSSGVYFYVLDAGHQRLTRKLVLVK